VTRLATVHTAPGAFHLLQMAGCRQCARFFIDRPQPSLSLFCQSLLFFQFGLKGCSGLWPLYGGADVSDLTQHKCPNAAESTMETHCSLHEQES
jgi:hypothetical protein